MNQASGLFARLSLVIADYREYLATFAELNVLSDCELADLGISRLSLRDIARDAVYQRSSCRGSSADPGSDPS